MSLYTYDERKRKYNLKMENTTPSPKTQAVIDAYEASSDGYKAFAAVIRAVADQVVSKRTAFLSPGTVAEIRAEILAIADELETL